MSDLKLPLTGPVARTRRGEAPAGRKPRAAAAVFQPWRGNVATTYVRSAIEKARPMPGPPERHPRAGRAVFRAARPELGWARPGRVL